MILKNGQDVDITQIINDITSNYDSALVLLSDQASNEDE